MDETVQTLNKRRIPRGLKLGLLGLLIVAGAGALLLAVRGLRGHAWVRNEGPLDIRLVGVCPDGGDELYDAEGRKLQTTLPPLGMEDATWKRDQQRRDFIFQVPAVTEPLLFLPFPRLRAAGTDYVQVARIPDELAPAEGASTLVASGTFDRTYRRRWLRLLTLTSPIDKVDLTLQYYYGARRGALCTFTGPFQVGTAVQADEGRQYQLTPEPTETWQEARIKFHFVTGRPFSSDTPILFYDKQGRRRYVHPGFSGRSGGNGADLTYNMEVLPWDEIAAITVGEKPYAITFRNVAVEYPEWPPHTQAMSWDRLGERLGVIGLSKQSWLDYRFPSAAEAVGVLDLVRSADQMGKVLQALMPDRNHGGGVTLDEATRDQIRRTATQWLQSPSAMGRAYGVRLGLLGGFREFVDPAFALLEYRHPTQSYVTMAIRIVAAGGLKHWYADHRTPEDLERLKHLARQGDNGAAWSLLFRECLVYPDPPANPDVLWELAQEDPPWVWWPALKVLLEREDPQSRAYSTWPQKMKLRLLLTSRGEQPDQAQLLPEARRLLAGLFTPRTLRMMPLMEEDLHTALTTCLDPKEATAVYMNFLRAVLQPATRRQFEVDDKYTILCNMVALLLRDLNAWYGLDLGGLGVSQPEQVNQGFQHPGDWGKTVAAALDWYQTGGGVPAVEPVLEVRVRDTDARGIPGATITLRQGRLAFDERGQRRHITTEVGTWQTDADGRVVFQNLEASSQYEFDIRAKGFAPRRSVGIDQLPDGRCRVSADAEENVIVLDKAARLTGRLLGADGRPLPRASVQVQSYSPHAPVVLRTVQTNPEGQFTCGPLMAGYHLVLYRYQGPPTENEDPRRIQALQLVPVEEGQTVENVTLDLREATAMLEVQIVGRAEPLTLSGRISLEMAIPFAEPQYAPIMSLRGQESQALQRFSNLPPLEGCLQVFAPRRQMERIPLKLAAGQTTRCRIGPEKSEVSPPARPAERQSTSGPPRDQGSSGGALVP